MTTFNVKKNRYDIDQILCHLGLKRSTNCEVLQRWLAISPATDYVLPAQLERKCLRLLEQGGLWNEEELKMHFISIVFDCADIEIPDQMQCSMNVLWRRCGQVRHYRLFARHY